ncbi:MAG: DUF1992 domain-containing protein [Anaerolineae bacterium]|nr:DUF1992 domain-containing protein [Anaerolineae bacterium]
MPLIDEQIQDAMRKGEFNDLPGVGKPLKLEADAHTPEHLRMAHKLLRDNDLVPDWMAQGRELDALRDKLVTDAQRLAHADPESAALAALHEAAKQYNRQVLSYNLKVPRGVVHKRHVDVEQERARAR